ncbi:MAG: autoinducer binding domain-containing protein, partial [Hyphomicrobiaceae bacterium]
MLQDLFFELVEKFDDQQTDEATFLRDLCREYDLSHAAYLGLNIPSIADQGIYLANTYEDSWCKRYISQGYVDLDPVVS